MCHDCSSFVSTDLFPCWRRISSVPRHCFADPDMVSDECVPSSRCGLRPSSPPRGRCMVGANALQWVSMMEENKDRKEVAKMLRAAIRKAATSSVSSTQSRPAFIFSEDKKKSGTPPGVFNSVGAVFDSDLGRAPGLLCVLLMGLWILHRLRILAAASGEGSPTSSSRKASKRAAAAQANKKK